MARPRKSRKLESLPAPVMYIPAGGTKNQPPPVEVAIEDFEIMRLVDGRGYQIAEAAEKTGVSRSTAGRMLERARRAIAQGIEKRAPVYLDASDDLVLEAPTAGKGRVQETGTQRSSSRLAIACMNKHEDTPVERIFGRAPSFVILSASGKPFRCVENPGFGAKRNAARHAAELLEAQGVARVAAGRFGPEALQELASRDIQALVASGITLGEAITFYNQEKRT
jgi:predicted DNA-binding protein (UPF0251 family)/predicted Fe-Mo cluster-binding NifX family protein